MAKKKKRTRGLQQALGNWQLYLMLLLPIIYLLVFRYQPMYGAQIAFRNYNLIFGIRESPWVGFDHFIRFFQSDSFIMLLRNTLLLSLYNLVASFPFPILLAFALHYVENQRYKKTVQMVTYLPHFISVVVIIGLLVQMTNPQYGIINQIIKGFGGKPIDFFGHPKYFRHLYVWSGIWKSTGWNSIIYLSALSSVDPELHEAAHVDGAQIVKRIWYIDLPSIFPTIITLFIMNIGSFLNLGFEKAFLMQNPLNIGTSEIIDTYVYKMGLASTTANFSYSTAIGLFQSLIGFILIVSVNQLSKKLTETSLW